MSNSTGQQDSQTVQAGGRRTAPPKIAGLKILELGNVLTRSGWMTEIFRQNWDGIEVTPRQINWVELTPGGVTDWHRHYGQIDHLVGVGGVIKLALWDGREDSPTYRESEIIRIGAMRPVLVVVPPGIWHALRNESGQPAGYLNITNQLYNYERPDNWRLAADATGIPNIL